MDNFNLFVGWRHTQGEQVFEGIYGHMGFGAFSSFGATTPARWPLSGLVFAECGCRKSLPLASWRPVTRRNKARKSCAMTSNTPALFQR